ncbi:MAG: hypothetical protein JXA49_03485 [Actinobacteria bacterium]|nr:hypothetical protein [Actinomycetota bacterium]
MALNKKELRTWRQLQLKVKKLEQASRAREKALKQVAEKLGVEIDLTRMPTAREKDAEELIIMSSKNLLRSKEVLEYLEEAEKEETGRGKDQQ